MPKDLPLEVLRQIRDEVRKTREEVHKTNERLSSLETSPSSLEPDRHLPKLVLATEVSALVSAVDRLREMLVSQLNLKARQTSTNAESRRWSDTHPTEHPEKV